ncbi:MAG: aminoacyl-tRNA hydrolase [Candidatus Magasanikbacteria bacterium]|jgi:PTH1 family peptidyl-tRNA hydrolase
MKLIIGLGNPGKEFEYTRHNAGWLALDKLIESEKLTSKKSSKLQAEISDFKVGRNKVILAKPQTFMNNSGTAVHTMINYYRLTAKDIVVVHDDKDIPTGEIRVQTNRGPAGHNGIKSIIEQIGTQDFTRIRIGVGPTPDSKEKIDVISNFVLNKFSKEEIKILQTALDNAVTEIKRLSAVE